MRRVIVAGGRDYADKDFLECIMAFHLNTSTRFDEIVILSGCAKGADSLALAYAKRQGLKVEEYPAEWDKYGKSAGPIRNLQMAQNADVLIAFWDGKSKGTKDMIEKAAAAKLELHVYFY